MMEAGLIDAAAVIRAMIEIRKQMEGDDQRTEELGLDEDELAFYDAVAENLEGIYEQGFLAEPIHQVVESVLVSRYWAMWHNTCVCVAIMIICVMILESRHKGFR